MHEVKNIMDKTVCELFAGVGGFRCGLNNIKDIKDTENKKNGKLYGLVSGNPLIRPHSGHMIVT